jgi:hypothetical protein
MICYQLKRSLLDKLASRALSTPQPALGLHDLTFPRRVLLTQLEINVETTLAALKLARLHGVMTILNTGAWPLSEPVSSPILKEFSLFPCVN